MTHISDSTTTEPLTDLYEHMCLCNVFFEHGLFFCDADICLNIDLIHYCKEMANYYTDIQYNILSSPWNDDSSDDYVDT